jgi:hypothetical protein
LIAVLVASTEDCELAERTHGGQGAAGSLAEALLQRRRASSQRSIRARAAAKSASFMDFNWFRSVDEVHGLKEVDLRFERETMIGA